MSHAATNWAIKQRGLKPATKIVLWHLADCHNGHTGQCNPRQSTLADLCEMSRSSLNEHLGKLEAAGLIRRVILIDERTKRQKPTQYILAFDEDKNSVSENWTRPQDVELSAQDVVVPCPDSGHGKQTDPCPDSGQTRVQNLDTIENPGKEPGKNKDHFDNDPSFLSFWDRWPLKRQGRKKAEASFGRLSKQNRKLAIERVNEWARKWRQQYPTASDMHPATYLNGHRWEDEFSQVGRSDTQQDWRPGSDIPSRRFQVVPPPAQKFTG